MNRDTVDLTFERIAERVRAADLPPRDEVDVVVAVARGGAVPGALIAYRLERPLRLLRLAFRDDANRPEREAPTPVGPVPDVRGLRVVLVDDVSVTGGTLRRAAELLGAARVTTVAFKGAPGAADVVLFPDVPSCVRWPWAEDVPPAARRAAPPRAVIVAGVAGSGKTTVGRRLAERLGWRYVEADDHHPPENTAKMARGEPLDDEDRAPWLASLRRELDDASSAGEALVMSCSALKRRYREVLTAGRPEAAMVLLHGPARLLEARMSRRVGHFFDPRLLRSQLETLELPGPDEDALVVDVAPEPEAIVERIAGELGLTVAGHRREPGRRA
jgi:gluconokinase